VEAQVGAELEIATDDAVALARWFGHRSAIPTRRQATLLASHGRS
jgi:hypothetical protein